MTLGISIFGLLRHVSTFELRSPLPVVDRKEVFWYPLIGKFMFELLVRRCYFAQYVHTSPFGPVNQPSLGTFEAISKSFTVFAVLTLSRINVLIFEIPRYRINYHSTIKIDYYQRCCSDRQRIPYG